MGGLRSFVRSILRSEGDRPFRPGSRKGCFLYFDSQQIYGVALAQTKDFTLLNAPVILIGDLSVLSDSDLGKGILQILNAFQPAAADDLNPILELNRSAQALGFRSYRTLWRDCLPMSLEEEGEDVCLTPHARYGKIGAGSVPLPERAVTVVRDEVVLGRAVRERKVYCL